MTERFKALTVVLETDTRSDDAENLMRAILQLRGVADVRGEVYDLNTHTAMVRVRTELGAKLMAILYP
jgi:hypothetical protein